MDTMNSLGTDRTDKLVGDYVTMQTKVNQQTAIVQQLADKGKHVEKNRIIEQALKKATMARNKVQVKLMQHLNTLAEFVELP
jgi:hypothetical protein